MTKTILFLAITVAFIAGSIATGTLAFAGGDDDDDLSQLVCEAGKVMTGILFEDDDEILDIVCNDQASSNRFVHTPSPGIGASFPLIQTITLNTDGFVHTTITEYCLATGGASPQLLLVVDGTVVISFFGGKSDFETISGTRILPLNAGTHTIEARAPSLTTCMGEGGIETIIMD